VKPATQREFPLAKKEAQPGKLLSRLSGSKVIGFAVAAALLAALLVSISLVSELMTVFFPGRRK